jgi:long-chain acyl-CoA synthetase
MYPGVHARTTPDRPAIVMAATGESVTYRVLDEPSARLARLWQKRGLRRGDHVAIVLENHPRYFDAVWAALRSGLYYTPINWHLTAEEVAYITADCGARSVVTSAIRGAQVKLVDVEVPLVLDGDLEGWERYERGTAGMSGTPPDDEPEGAGMFYSSGTTGRPKGIVFPLPDGSVRDGTSLRVDPRLAHSPDDTYLSPAPLYHAAPVVSCSLVHRAGGTVVVLERWDAKGCLAAIERYRCTHAQFVPTMFVRLLKLPENVRRRYDLSSLRRVTHAAAPWPRRREAGDDRLVGPDPVGVLLRLGEHRHDDHRAGGVARPSRFRRPAHALDRACLRRPRAGTERGRDGPDLVRHSGCALRVPRRPSQDGGGNEPSGVAHARRHRPRGQ